jgi:hypothetical protein
MMVMKQEERDGIWHVRGTGEVNIRFWWGEVTERDHLENTDVDWRMMMMMIIIIIIIIIIIQNCFRGCDLVSTD